MADTDHTEIRLEKNGEVVAYLAPNFEINPTLENNLSSGGTAPWPGFIVRDFQKIDHRITAQGVFEDSDALPEAHRSDLETLFEKSPVTAWDQIHRLAYFVKIEGGPFELYEGNDEYTATTENDIDYLNGVFPTVNIEQIRTPTISGATRREYTIEMAVGFDASE